MLSPFKIDSEDIARLSDLQLTQLLKDLLHAECLAFQLAQRSVEVALNIRVGDGGEDGRISWSGSIDQTDYIPNRLTQFQNKATEMGPAQYAAEVVTSDGREIKRMVNEVLSDGGSYIVFTTQELNVRQKSERIDAIRATFRSHGRSYAETADIRIYDSAIIAGWVNCYLSTVLSVQFWTARTVERGLKNYKKWQDMECYSSLPYEDVPSRAAMLSSLRASLNVERACFRIVGLSGMGKTRMALEALSADEFLKSWVVYVDVGFGINIAALLSDWISHNYRIILVVDNCDYTLHEKLVKEVRRSDSKVTLLTMDYNLERVSGETNIYHLEPMTDDEILKLISPAYADKVVDLERVAKFAQGFPQIAVMLANARVAEDPEIGQLTDDDIAHKLLWGRDDNRREDYLKILQVCSLFDFFGVTENVESQLEYISTLIGLDVNKVYECICHFADRGLIDRRGRFAQVVPKPLAIRLAVQWWRNTRLVVQTQLIDGMPGDMVDQFCTQIEKLDFHPQVKELTRKLCGDLGFFGNAEVICSDRGSRLFRSFVTVNPEDTCQALYEALIKMSREELVCIAGNVRRNLVLSLERLSFHENLFSEAAWCLLLLGVAENEHWSNNARGIFVQLFRVYLSGTPATPEQRIALIDNAIDLKVKDVDLVLIDAISAGLDVRGGFRAIGAEDQGLRPRLKDWAPTYWQEVFDYWSELIDRSIVLYGHGEVQAQKVLECLGSNLRGIVSRGQVDLVESVLKRVVALNGPYWPSANESIRHVLQFDLDSAPVEIRGRISGWLELLNPLDGEVEQRLKIVVISPAWEHERNSSGNYIDIAEINAKRLAIELADRVDEIVDCLPVLLQGNPRQSFVFGMQLALSLEDATDLLWKSFRVAQQFTEPNLKFIYGLLRGIYEKDCSLWRKCCDCVLNDDELRRFYFDVVRVGKVTGSDLINFKNLIAGGLVSFEGLHGLAYGGVLEEVDASDVMEFCLFLSDRSDHERWLSLNLACAYFHFKNNKIESVLESVRDILLSVPLGKTTKWIVSNFSNWKDLCERVFEKDDGSFSLSVLNQILDTNPFEFDHGVLWHYIKPLLIDMMGKHYQILWPVLSSRIEEVEGMDLYWMGQLLDRENSLAVRMNSVFSQLPVSDVIDWCNRDANKLPAFVAGCVDMFIGDAIQEPAPLFIEILSNFGHDPMVSSALFANMNSRGWSGSLVPILENDKKAVSALLDYPNENVRRWAVKRVSQIDAEILRESSRDDEQGFGIY